MRENTHKEVCCDATIDNVSCTDHIGRIIRESITIEIHRDVTDVSFDIL